MTSVVSCLKSASLAIVFLLVSLLGSAIVALGQQDARYPIDFDAKLVSGDTTTVDGSTSRFNYKEISGLFDGTEGCGQLYVREGYFSYSCEVTWRDVLGDCTNRNWIQYDWKGQIESGVLSGNHSQVLRVWHEGCTNADNGLFVKGKDEGTLEGQLLPHGQIKITASHTQVKQVMMGMENEDGYTRHTGSWKNAPNHPSVQPETIVYTFRFDRSSSQKPNPFITAQAIKQEWEENFQEALELDSPTSDDFAAVQDTQTTQGSGEEQKEMPDPSATQPIDKFDAWKQDYENRGWRYSEKDGIAEFKPQEGARDEKGWIYSEETGDFLQPPQTEKDMASIEDLTFDARDKPRQPLDGDENDKGEVWSDEDGGWIGRSLYDQEKERRAHIKELNERSNLEQDEDVNKLYDAWQTSKKQGKLQPEVFKRVADQKRDLDARIEKLISGETDLDRIRFLRDLQDQLNDIDVVNKDGVLGDWHRVVAGQEVKTAFKVDYTMKQFIVETEAMLLDTVLTRGAAMVTLHSYKAAVKESKDPNSSKASVLWEGTKEGVYQGTIGYVLNRLVVVSLSKANAMRKAATAVKGTADDVAVTSGKIKGNWNSSSDAIRQQTQKKLLAKLPANHPARQIGKINETLGKASRQFDARKINPHMRLDPNSEIYKSGIEALKKNPRYLTDKAKKVTDAVRHDLDLAARERAVIQLYEDHPALKGHLTHFENTGSHARKGINYRGGASDIDFTPKGTATPQGKEAEKLFAKYYEKAVGKVSAGKLTTKDLKAHAYSGDKGTGAFRSKTGLNVKDVMNQTSGRIDKLDPSGKITHSLRGDDIIEIKEPTRIFDKGVTSRITKQDVATFRKDLANKFREELPEMGTQQEKLIQAAKGYKLSRVIEAKAVGGRPLSANRALYQWSKQVKKRIPNMSDAQIKAMTRKFLNGIERGQ